MRFEPAIFARFRSPAGGEASPDSIAFSSLDGAGSLAGWSAYRPTGNTQDVTDPLAPWNAGAFLKYRTRSIAGVVWSEAFTEEGGGGDLICFLPGSFPIPAAYSTGARWSGVAAFVGAAPATAASKEDKVYYVGGADPFTGACNVSWAAPSPVFGCDLSAPYFPDELVAETVRIVRGVGIVNAPPESLAQARSINHEGEVIEVIGTPDSFYAAIERAGGGVVGTASESAPGFVATTEPGSADPIPFTAARAIRATAAFSRILVGHAYTLRAWYRLRGLDGRDDTTLAADAAYTPAASSVSIPHDLPVVPGYAVSLTALRLLP